MILLPGRFCSHSVSAAAEAVSITSRIAVEHVVLKLHDSVSGLRVACLGECKTSRPRLAGEGLLRPSAGKHSLQFLGPELTRAWVLSAEGTRVSGVVVLACKVSVSPGRRLTSQVQF